MSEKSLGDSKLAYPRTADNKNVISVLVGIVEWHEVSARKSVKPDNVHADGITEVRADGV